MLRLTALPFEDVLYCDATCQRAHWRAHRDACKAEVASMVALGAMGDGDALLNMATSAFEAQDAPKAFDLWKRAAEAGQVLAMFNLAMCYRDATGTMRNMPQCVRWLNCAADSGRFGSGSANCALSELYANGNGVKQDAAESLRRLRLAASAGHALAAFNLGQFHAEGRGGVVDDVEALRWYRRAAEQSEDVPLGDALLKIGWFHECGRGGLPADPLEASRWYRRAAAEGSPQAMVNLGNDARDGSCGSRRSQTDMLRLYRQAAEAGHGDAAAALAAYYTMGLPSDTPGAPPVVVPNAEQAAMWSQRAAAAGAAPPGCGVQ